MSRIRIAVDGTTVMDANVTPNSGDLPELSSIQSSLQKNTTGEFKPWITPTIQALGMTLAPMLAGQTIPDTTFTVTTRTNGWTLNVTTV